MKSVRHYNLLRTPIDSIGRNTPREARINEDSLIARSTLLRTMDTTGWETLQDIFDRFPDSVVEFSVLKGTAESLDRDTLDSNTIF